MKILLIQPSQLDRNAKPVRYKKVIMPFLTMPTIAGLTPDNHGITVINDYVEDIPYDQHFDLVGLTGLTCQAPRAYQIAREFKKRGIKTIMGGIHASYKSEEALEYVDSVFIGEAEETWEAILEEFEKTGTLKKVYRANQLCDLSACKTPRYDLVNPKYYRLAPFTKKIENLPVQTTRGCPFFCDFCSVMNYLGNTIRKKPVHKVIEEIKAAPPFNYIFFTDDNIIGDPAYAKELFAAIKPLKIKWYSQASTNLVHHPDLIEAAAESGCMGLLIGLETNNRDKLKQMKKHQNNPDSYHKLFSLLKKHDILADVSILFGVEGEDEAAFLSMVSDLKKLNAHFMYLFFLTPLPGTQFESEIEKKKRRLFDDWSLYDGLHQVISFPQFTGNTAQDIYWKAYQDYYSLGNITKQLWKFRKQYFKKNPTNNFFTDMFFYLIFHGIVKKRNNSFSVGW